MAYTEFCCRSGGSNLNAGTRTGNTTVPGTAADLTYASGNWVQSTGVFTVASGNPVSDGVAVGDFASVYPDGASVGVFIGRVTARDATTITVSLTAKAGAAPTNGTGNRTLKIGGAWKGPNGAEDFPFDLATLHTLQDASANHIRVNMMNDATYAITAAIAPSSPAAGVYLQGFTAAYEDGGRAVIDGGTSGASYFLLNNTVAWWMTDLEFQNNGATGSSSALGTGNFRRVVVHDVRGCGWLAPSGLEECEAYNCNQSNTSNFGGAQITTINLKRCFFHDNLTSNSSGVVLTGSTASPVLISCVFHNNRAHIRAPNNGVLLQMVGCDFYESELSSLILSRTSGSGFVVDIDNCNFVLSGGYFIDCSGIVINLTGHLVNCGFGDGSMGASSTPLNGMQSVANISPVTYDADVTPWADPDNGDFRIVLEAAKGTGRGTFFQTAASYAGTIGYPDRGAAQHLDSAVGGGIARSRLVNAGG